MKNKLFVIALFAISALKATADTTYSDKASFLSALNSGYYLNNFSSLTAFNSSPITSLSFNGGTPNASYTINSAGGLFVNNDVGNAVGNWVQSDDVLVNLTSGNVYAVGAEFYLNDISGANQNGVISLGIDDGTTGSATSSATGAYGFFGVISDNPITTFTVSHSSAGFLNIANLAVEGLAPVPEPSAFALVFAGLAGAIASRRR